MARRAADTTRELEAWLRAEARTDDPEAERALVALMGALPSYAPSAGFAGRVLARAGVLGVAVAADVFAERWVRWAVGCALAAAAVSLLVAPALLGPIVQWLSLARVVGLLTDGVVLGARWIGAGAGFWRTAAEVGSAVALAASKPPVALGLLAMVAASAGAFRALNRLMSPERSASHV